MIPLIGVFEKPQDIDFNSLPEKFVLKCNHGAGYNYVNDGSSVPDVQKLIAEFNRHLETNYAFVAYGWDDLDLNHGFDDYRGATRWSVSPDARVETFSRLLHENFDRAATTT